MINVAEQKSSSKKKRKQREMENPDEAKTANLDVPKKKTKRTDKKAIAQKSEQPEISTHTHSKLEKDSIDGKDGQDANVNVEKKKRKQKGKKAKVQAPEQPETLKKENSSLKENDSTDVKDGENVSLDVEKKKRKRKDKKVKVQELEQPESSKEENADSEENSNDEKDEQNAETPETKETPKTPSIRQQKKTKFEQRKTEEQELFKKEAQSKALNYVSNWKHAKSEWRFQKIRQVWLVENLLDEKSIPEKVFPTALEYFEGCKGLARQKLVESAMSIIKKAEHSSEEKGEDEVLESTEYKRARQILQALPTDK